MLYLAKANRSFGNHQYIIGVYKDRDIACFQAWYHCKFERADKYIYSLEEISWCDDSCHIVSWETGTEMLAYKVFMGNLAGELQAQELFDTAADQDLYRVTLRSEPVGDYDISHEDFCHVASTWWFGNSTEVKGLHKVYEHFRGEDANIDRAVAGAVWGSKFWEMFWDSQKGR